MSHPYSVLGGDIQGNVTLSPIMREQHFLLIDLGQNLGQESTQG